MGKRNLTRRKVLAAVAGGGGFGALGGTGTAAYFTDDGVSPRWSLGSGTLELAVAWAAGGDDGTSEGEVPIDLELSGKERPTATIDLTVSLPTEEGTNNPAWPWFRIGCPDDAKFASDLVATVHYGSCSGGEEPLYSGPLQGLTTARRLGPEADPNLPPGELSCLEPGETIDLCLEIALEDGHGYHEKFPDFDDKRWKDVFDLDEKDWKTFRAFEDSGLFDPSTTRPRRPHGLGRGGDETGLSDEELDGWETLVEKIREWKREHEKPPEERKTNFVLEFAGRQCRYTDPATNPLPSQDCSDEDDPDSPAVSFLAFCSPEKGDLGASVEVLEGTESEPQVVEWETDAPVDFVIAKGGQLYTIYDLRESDATAGEATVVDPEAAIPSYEPKFGWWASKPCKLASVLLEEDGDDHRYGTKIEFDERSKGGGSDD